MHLRIAPMHQLKKTFKYREFVLSRFSVVKLQHSTETSFAYGTVTPLIKAYFVAGAGLDPEKFEGGADEVRPAIARAIVEGRGPAIGVDFSDLNEDLLNDAAGVS